MKKNIPDIVKIICKHILLLVVGAVVGLLLLVAVFCLPVEPMQTHVWQSLPLLEQEFDAKEIIMGYPATLPGSFTDCLMLEHAVYENPEHSMLSQILYMYRGESGLGDGWAPGLSLKDYLEGTSQPREEQYARYWHGYLVVLKPLLLLTNLNTLRLIAAFVQLFLIGLIVMSCAKRGEMGLGVSFLFSLPFLYFSVLYVSLSLSICFYLCCVLLAVQLSFHEKLNEKGIYWLFFLIGGMMTSYFDFLTYPLVTLGFPLCVCLYFNCDSLQKSLQKLVSYSVEWGVGYLGMWAMKWVLCDLLTGGNVIADGIATIFVRTGNAQDKSRLSGYGEVLSNNLGVYANWAFAVLIMGFLLWLLIWLLRQNKHSRIFLKGRFSQTIPILLVAVYPFLWFFAAQNHSQQHWMFTCKIVAVSAFAVAAGLSKLIGFQGNNQ